MFSPVRRAVRAQLLSSGLYAATAVLAGGFASDASAAPAVFFNDNLANGRTTLVNTITAADATAAILEFDILSNSTNSSGVIAINTPSGVVYVRTTQNGVAVRNTGTGDRGGTGFHNWGNSHNGTFAGAEQLGYTLEFFSDAGLTSAFTLNALGLHVNNWGTCCATNNPTPSGGRANASEIYLRFGTDTPLLLGGISRTIGGTEHFIGAVNDTNFFNRVTVIATGNGEFFGAGSYLMFSTVPLNSVPAGSSVVSGSGLSNPAVSPPATPSIPDIDTAAAAYTTAQVAAGQVNTNFVGGTLRFGSAGSIANNFTVQSQGGTIDSNGNDITISGDFSGAGRMIKAGNGVLILTGTNTHSGGFLVSSGVLAIDSIGRIGTGNLEIGNGTLRALANFASGRALVLSNNNSGIDTQLGNVSWSGVISGSGGLNVSGGGVLTLSGLNTYTGMTRVGVGTVLVVDSAANLGSTSGIELTGDPLGTPNGRTATLRFNGSTTLDKDIAVAGDPTIDVVAGTVEISGTISDGATAGDIVKEGAGTLVLTADNTYTGGTTINSGVLQLGAGGTTGSIVGNVVNNASLVVNRSNDLTLSGAISGSGSVTKNGAGVLTLSGANTYSGGTTVSAGTLRGTSTSLQGAIANNAAVEFAQATDGTYAGAMTGSGSLTKTGAGVLTLSGANTYSGGTTVSAGTLRGTSTSLQGAIANNAAVEFAQATNGTYAGAMTGSGSLTKTGAGVLTLSGANTYSGGTTVSAGTLRGTSTSLQGAIANNAVVEFAQAADGTYAGVMSGSGALIKTGAGVLTLTGANSYSGGTGVAAGTLRGNSSSLQGLIVNLSSVEFAQATDGTYAGVMSGTGSLTKTGAGVLTLSGANTYSGGTTVSEGRLKGDTTSVQGAIENNAEVEFAQATDGTYAGVMSGTGSLTKTEDGVLTLSGANTYSGGTTVSAGTLRGTTTSLQGAIANNAVVEFAQANDGTYAGAMTGSGTLFKTGAGVLTLTGTSGISGATTLSGGELAVDGVLRTSSLSALSNTTLSGVGTIGGNVAVGAGATLSPGKSPGTLTVDGDVSLAAGSRFEIEIDGRVHSAAGGFGSYDRIALTGAGRRFTAGGVLAPTLRGISGDAFNTFIPVYGDVFTVVTGGAIAGSFAGVIQPTLGMPTNSRFDVLYNANNLALTLTPNSYAALAESDLWTGNAGSAAVGLDAVRPAAGVRDGALQGLFNELYLLDRGELPNAFHQLSGQIHADAMQSARVGFVTANEHVMDSARNGYGDHDGDGVGIWSTAFGYDLETERDLIATAYRDKTEGVVVGVTGILESGVRFGLAGSASKADLTGALGSSADVDTRSFHAYFGNKLNEKWSYAVAAGVSHFKSATVRELDLSERTLTSFARGSGRSVNASLDIRYIEPFNDFIQVGLVAGLSSQKIRAGIVNESGAGENFDLALPKESWNLFQGRLGSEIFFGKGSLKGVLYTIWDHEFGDERMAERIVNLGPATWQVRSMELSDDNFTVGVGLDAVLSENFAIRANVGQLQNKGTSFTSTVGNISFLLSL